MEKVRHHLHTEKGKSSAFVIIILILAIVLAVAFFGDKLPLIKQSGYQVLAPSPVPLANLYSQTYTNTQYGIEFNYPNGWMVAEINSKNEKMLHSILQVTPKGFKGETPPIKLLYAPNPNQLSLQNLEKSSATKNQPIPVFFSSDDVYTLSGQGLPAYYRAEGNCVTTKCQIYSFSSGSLVYQLVSFPGVNSSDQKRVFDQIFNTLKFSGASKPD